MNVAEGSALNPAERLPTLCNHYQSSVITIPPTIKSADFYKPMYILGLVTLYLLL